MPRLRLVPEQLEVTSFAPVPFRSPAGRELERAAFTRLGEKTCGGVSCDYACITYFDPTCPNVCL
jgi:hypothetical protein